jgi:hypothetical protein
LTTKTRWLPKFATGLIGELRIALPSGRNADHVLRDQMLERDGGGLDVAGLRQQRHLPHMGDVEQAGGGTGV